MVSGMKEYSSHSGKNSFLNQSGYVIGNALMRHMSPPDDNVGIIKNFLGDSAVFILFEPCVAYFKLLVLAEKLTDTLVNSLGIDLSDSFFLKLMNVFVPNKNSDHNKNLTKFYFFQ